MPWLEINNWSFTSDPGIRATAGGNAAARIWDNINERWVADFQQDDTDPSYAYIKTGYPQGFKPESHLIYRATQRHKITGGSVNGAGFVGFHSWPPIDTGDGFHSIVGYEITHESDGHIYVGAVIVDNEGTAYVGTPVDCGLASGFPDLDIESSYSEATRQLTVSISNHGGGAIGSDTATIPSDKTTDPLTVYATRDGHDNTGITPLNGWIDDIVIEWSIPLDATGRSTEWILYQAGLGAVIMTEASIWYPDRPPRYSEIDAQGRPWSSRNWEGAGAQRVSLEGTLLADYVRLRNILLLINDWHTNGRVVTLYSPEEGHQLEDAQIDVWTFPQERGRVNNRDFLLEVKSRREPQIT